MDGMIFQIQRFSLHDGPGIRTTVFFKGCNLRCNWCHNPESFSRKPQIYFYKNRCTSCGNCRLVCKNHSISDKTNCIGCGACANVCLNDARVLVGEKITSDEVFDMIKRDIPFYESSGGGATFSGGEPLLQPEFLLDILKQCENDKIHTTVESALNIESDAILSLIPFVNLWKVDCKLYNPLHHKKATGVTNEKILSNIALLSEYNVGLNVNIPIISDINNDKENLENTAIFLSELKNPPKVSIILFHNLASNKYEQLDINYPAINYITEEKEQISIYKKNFTKYGLTII